MTISSSLNAGVAGLNANATRLAAISDNIANSATSGYKRVSTEFSAMVLGGSGEGSYAAGGVRARTTRLIDEQSTLVSTSNSTDLAISGRGFLPVTTADAIGGDSSSLLLTTTGSFRTDANGYLTTSSGLVLLGWPADASGNIGNFSRDSMSGLQPINVNTNQFAGNPTTAVALTVNLPADNATTGSTAGANEMTVEYFGNLGNSESLLISYEPTGVANQWTMTISDSASADAVVGRFTLDFNTGATNGGTIATVTPDTTYGATYDGATGQIALTTGHGPLTIGIGTPGAGGGITQLAAAFSPSVSSRDGSAIGNFSSVEVTDDGMVVAIYDNGTTRTIYQVPVVDVANPNGLTALDNQTYALSRASGSMYLWNAGEGPTGTISGYSTEESATDVATELTNLIQTQRAYSSNAKVIQTVDEMLQETTNIKR